MTCRFSVEVWRHTLQVEVPWPQQSWKESDRRSIGLNKPPAWSRVGVTNFVEFASKFPEYFKVCVWIWCLFFAL